MKLGHRLRTMLRILLTPSCWVRNYRTSRELSDWINAALDAGHRPKRRDEATAILAGRSLWVANYPYAYGSPNLYPEDAVLPDRATVFRLYDAVQESTPYVPSPSTDWSLDTIPPVETE